MTTLFSPGFSPLAAEIQVQLCTYNERENIAELIAAVLSALPSAHVLVVDDNSPDGTGAIVDAVAAADPRVRALHRPGKLGLGTAIRAGLQAAIDGQYRFAINMDADFSHSPDHLPSLLAAMTDCDVAVGSRYVAGGGIEGWSWRRHVMSRMINGYTRLLLGLPTRDCSGGYRCYRVETLQKVDLAHCICNGYAVQQELLFRCRRAGGRLVEVPILFMDRERGRSKIGRSIAIQALKDIARLALERFGLTSRGASPNSVPNPGPVHEKAPQTPPQQRDG